MMQTIFRAGIEADDDDDHGEDDYDSDEMRWDEDDYGGDNIDNFESEHVKKRSNLVMPGKSSIKESLK